MISIAFYVVSSCVAVSAVYSLLFLALMIENHRFWRSRSKQPAPTQPTFPRVQLIIPCKGMEPGLRDNLLAFIRQDYGNYEIAFVVESVTDPAAALIRSLIRDNRFQKIKLIIAGLAESSGQKIHNLIAGVNQVEKDVEVLVFADSDAMPAGNWLRWMVFGLYAENVGARTGYRWMVPKRNNLPTLLACTINNSVAALSGRGRYSLIWGGSWAITRKVFEQSGMKQAWFGVLSDDLMATNVIRHSKLDIHFEPRCLCATPVQFSWGQLFEFLYRQFLIVKKYTYGFWLSAVLLSLANQIAFWGSLVLTFAATASGNYGIAGLMAVATMTLGGGSLIRSLLRQKMGRFAVANWGKQKTAKIFDMAAGQVAGLFALIMILASAFGSRIKWRGIGYHISQGGRIQILGRQVSLTERAKSYGDPSGQSSSEDTNQHNRAA